MKKWMFIFLFALSNAAYSQQTATLTDSDGIVWINGTWSASLISPNGAPSVNRVLLTAAQQYAQGVIDGSGALSATLVPTNTLDQANCTWRFTINPNAAVSASYVSTTVTSTTQNLTSILSAGIKAPRFAAGPGAFGYADLEVYPNAALGATYYNTTTPALRQFSRNGWTSASSGGGSGTVTSVGATGTAIVDVTVTNPTTTPLIILTLPNQAANCALGNFTGSAASPTCSSTPQFNGANITGLNFTQLGGSASIAQLPATVVQTVGTATANVILKRTTSNTATDSSLTDNGTTITTSESITAPTFTGALAGNASTATTSTNLSGGFLGSIPYQSAVDTTTSLAGNITTTSKVLTQVGNGTVSAAPAWTTPTGTGTPVYSASPTLTGTVTAPTFSGALSGNATTATSATTATTATNLPGGLLGAIPYQSAVGATTLLAGSTSSALVILTETGNGTISAAPQWNATTGTGSVVMSASPTLTGAVTAARFTSNQATGTAPFTITSTTPVTNLVVSKHPLEQYCGTTTTCSATAQTGGQIVYGSVALVAGSAVVTGISPAFADTNYSCTGSIKSGTTIADGFFIANTSVSSITITGVGTDVISYVCIR